VVDCFGFLRRFLRALAADDQCPALWLGAELSFDALHGRLVDAD
jgi:hypothetical protein